MPIPRSPSVFVGLTLMLGTTGQLAFAQQAPINRAQAQQHYEAEVSGCNRGNLPAPAREACVRNAGNALDRTLGGPPTETATPSADGRATVVAPVGSNTPSAASDTVTSGDGRATIVLPADRAAALSG